MKKKKQFKEYDTGTLKKIQQVELEILKDFMDICDRHGLTYFGIAGTGIGALRHQGFIPWDDDIDVAMPEMILRSCYAWLRKRWEISI